jgi:hypothetical protein
MMPNRHAVTDTLVAFLAAGTASQKMSALGLAVLGSAIWDAYTSLAVAVLALFILADVVLGVSRAVHEGGLAAFSEQKFWRSGVKAVASFVVIAVMVGMDAMVHASEESLAGWSPFLASGVTVLCVGYLTSIAKNGAYFSPGLTAIFDRFQSKHVPHDRRSGDND